MSNALLMVVVDVGCPERKRDRLSAVRTVFYATRGLRICYLSASTSYKKISDIAVLCRLKRCHSQNIWPPVNVTMVNGDDGRPTFASVGVKIGKR